MPSSATWGHLHEKLFSDEHIISILRGDEAGVSAQERCCKRAISDAMWYTRCKKFGGMEVPKVKRLNSPEEETPASRSSSPKQCWRRRRFGSSEPKILTTDQKRDTVEAMCEATGICRYAVQRPVADLSASHSWRLNAGALVTAESAS